VIAALALALAGCGGDAGSSVDTPAATSAGTASSETTARPARARRPALCARLRASVTGRVSAPAATELSGLVLSRSRRGVLWTHNDSGDRPRLLAIATDGRLLADVTLGGAEAVDWEDVTAGRGTVFAGDIGDNLAQRASIVVYRLAEPRVAGAAVTSEPRVGEAAPTITVAAARIELRYPDGPRDAEALLRDPTSGALVVVEKNYAGRAGVYVAAAPRAGAAVTMRRSGRLELGPGEAVTAGDVSPDGRTIALRSYDRVFVWTRRAGESVAAALRRAPCTAGAELLAEGQAEALALSPRGNAFYTVPEGPRPPIRRYAPLG